MHLQSPAPVSGTLGAKENLSDFKFRLFLQPRSNTAQQAETTHQPATYFASDPDQANSEHVSPILTSQLNLTLT